MPSSQVPYLPKKCDITIHNLLILHVAKLRERISTLLKMMTDASSDKMPPPQASSSLEADSSGTEPTLTKQEKIKIEREQEQKLKARYPKAARPMIPGGMHGPGVPGGGPVGGGHSAFLQKRLGKGQKFFDSGDYNMAKQGSKRPGAPGRMMIPVLAQPPTGDTIPTPDTVPARKTSIIQPLHDHRFLSNVFFSLHGLFNCRFI